MKTPPSDKPRSAAPKPAVIEKIVTHATTTRHTQRTMPDTTGNGDDKLAPEPPEEFVAKTKNEKNGSIVRLIAIILIIIALIVAAVIIAADRSEKPAAAPAGTSAADPFGSLRQYLEDQNKLNAQAAADKQAAEKKIAELQQRQVAPPAPAVNVPNLPTAQQPNGSSSGTTAQAILADHTRGNTYELCDDVVAMFMGPKARQMQADKVINVGENVLAVADQGKQLFILTRKSRTNGQIERLDRVTAHGHGQPTDPGVSFSALDAYIKRKVAATRSIPGAPDWIKLGRQAPTFNPPDSNGSTAR